MPEEGWHYTNFLGLSYVSHDTSIWYDEPEVPGLECYFVARHGNYTRYSYKLVK